MTLCTIETKIIKIKAEQEQLTVAHNALFRDKEVVDNIIKLLQLKSEAEIWKQFVQTSIMMSDEILHRSYLLILARCILRSQDHVTSDGLRSRFVIAAYMVQPGNVEMSKQQSKEMRAKYINLLDLHGAVREPNIWERFIAKLQGWFSTVREAT